MIDLFGNKIEEVPIKNPISKYQKFKVYNNYRLSLNKKERCKTCKYCICFEYHNKRYYKCEQLGFSNGRSTDVKIKNVCNLYEERRGEK